MSCGRDARRIRECVVAGDVSKLEGPDMGDMADPLSPPPPLTISGDVTAPRAPDLSLLTPLTTTIVLAPVPPDRITDVDFRGSCDC